MSNDVFSEQRARALDKYGKDGPFAEPVMRCDSCAELILRSDLHKRGMCECGNTRVRNVLTVKEKEMPIVQKWIDEGKIDSDWLALWEAKE
jgi:hypothetical protein